MRCTVGALDRATARPAVRMRSRLDSGAGHGLGSTGQVAPLRHAARSLATFAAQRTGQCALLGIACGQCDISDRRGTGAQLMLGPAQPARTEPCLRTEPEFPLEQRMQATLADTDEASHARHRPRLPGSACTAAHRPCMRAPLPAGANTCSNCGSRAATVGPHAPAPGTGATPAGAASAGGTGVPGLRHPARRAGSRQSRNRWGPSAIWSWASPAATNAPCSRSKRPRPPSRTAARPAAAIPTAHSRGDPGRWPGRTAAGGRSRPCAECARAGISLQRGRASHAMAPAIGGGSC